MAQRSMDSLEFWQAKERIKDENTWERWKVDGGCHKQPTSRTERRLYLPEVRRISRKAMDLARLMTV